MINKNTIIKKCSKCGRNKTLQEFTKDNSKKDGYYSSCKNCYRERLGIKKRIYSFYWKGIPAGKSGEYLAVNGKRIHRMVAEEKLGRKLNKTECVHHINGNKYDNRPENIEIVDSNTHHSNHTKMMWNKREYKLDEEKIKEYFNNGLGEKLISKLFNVSPIVISIRLKKLGMKRDKLLRATKKTFELFKKLQNKS